MLPRTAHLRCTQPTYAPATRWRTRDFCKALSLSLSLSFTAFMSVSVDFESVVVCLFGTQKITTIIIINTIIPKIIRKIIIIKNP